MAAAAVAVPVPGSRSGPETAQPFQPRVPSQAPPPPSFDAPADSSTNTFDDIDAILADAGDHSLQARLQRWADARGVGGAAIAVGFSDGATTTAATGHDDEGKLRAAEDPIQLESVTKLFTANLVYRAVDSGLLDLDAPLPTVAPFAAFPHADRLTARQLLTHRSGLVNYRDTAEYREDPASIVQPIDAVMSSVANTSEADLGSPRYSSTNFLVLGLLLEKVTGRDFAEMLRTELLDPLDLRATSQLPSEPGEPRFSTGGLVSDLGDLIRAGTALLRDHVGISDTAFRTMSVTDPEAGMSAGTMDYCPCTIDDAGEHRSFAYGYAGGDALLVYVPASDAIVAVAVTGGITSDERLRDVMALVQAVSRDRPAPQPPEETSL